MKVLSKYFKVALCFMAFALCSFMFAFTPTLTAVQAASLTSVSYDKALNALKMPTTEVDYNTPGKDVFKVPLLSSTVGSVTSYTIRVVDPAGYNHDYVVGTSADDNFFKLDAANDMVEIKARNNGEYKVVYIVTNANRSYYSNTYTVNVTNVSYVLDFSTPVLKTGTDEVIGHTKNLIKTKMAVSTEAYELPVAYAKRDGEELTVVDGVVTNAKAEIAVTKDGAPQDYTTSKFFTKNGDKYFITPSEAGVYTVEYTFERSENRPTKTYTIHVEENFVASNLKLASTPTMPSIELGKTVTLPKISVNAGDQTNVDVNVTSIRIEKEGSNSAIYCELKDNNFTFDMTPKSFGLDSYDEMVGNYRVTYNVKDANGKTLTETFKVDGVTVTSKPTIKLAYNFDTANTNNVVFGAETELKAEYEAAPGIVLPAVYVEDAVTTNYSDFKVIRTIRKGNTYYYIDNKKYDEETGTFVDVTSDQKGYNASGDANIGNTNKAVTFKFNSNAQNVEGDYQLEYRVITKEVKERESYLYVPGTSEKFTFKIVPAGTHKETTPTIQITNLKNSSVKNTDNITVKVSSKDDLDTRLKNAVFTYTTSANLGGEDTFTTILQQEVDNLLNALKTNKSSHVLNDARLINGWSIDTTDESGDPVTLTSKGLRHYFTDIVLVNENETKNSFDLNLTDVDSGEVSVIAVAINDDGNVGTDTKVLTIKDTADPDAPEMSVYVEHLTGTNWIDGENKIQEFKVGQGVDVKLPTVYVADDDKTLILNVMYYIDSPENSYGGIKYLSPSNKKFFYEDKLFNDEVQAIDGGVITTSETGIYYVAYTATDVAGNTSVMYFTFEVEDTSNPVLSVVPVSNDEIKISGNTVTASKGTVIDFEATLKSADGKLDYTNDKNITVTIDDNNKGLDYQPSGDSRTSYVFNGYGTYMVTIGGSYDGRDADSKTIKVVIEKKTIEWLGNFDVVEYAGKGKPVKLPDVAASNGAVVKVTYTLPNGTTDEAIEAEKVTEASGYSYWTFETDADLTGTYKVTYTATNDEDVLTKTVNIKVGDNVAPTISIGNKAKVQQELIYDGENDIEYVVEVNKTKTSTKNRYFKITVTNNGEVVYSQDVNLSLSDKDDEGKTLSMSWSSLTYELTGPNVRTGDTSSNKTQYLIGGTGKYVLKISAKDTYENVRTETIEFNVVTKSNAEEKNDTVVGAVLIVISLILLAGVILFFTFTGKNGGNTKVKKDKAPKVKAVKEEVEVEEDKVEFVEEVKEEKVEETENVEVEEVQETESNETEEVETTENSATEQVEETSTEVAAETEEKVEDEPKSGDVE